MSTQATRLGLQICLPFVGAQLSNRMGKRETWEFWHVLNRRKHVVILAMISGLGLASNYWARTEASRECAVQTPFLVMNQTSRSTFSTEVLLPHDKKAQPITKHGFRLPVLTTPSKAPGIWPTLAVVLGIGGLAGLAGGLGLVFLAESADEKFYHPAEITKRLRLPVMGHIPPIPQATGLPGANSRIKPIVCAYHAGQSPAARALASLCQSLTAIAIGKQHGVIQVTSPVTGDGKSTLASNLAVTLARTGKRVVLVDADMRRPVQATNFGIEASQGLAAVLGSQIPWRDALVEVEVIRGLTIMPCGRPPINPAELSSASLLKQLIGEMRAEFDMVVIDTPPLLAVMDPCRFAVNADAVILTVCIKQGITVRAEKAVAILEKLKVNVAGVVVNGHGTCRLYRTPVPTIQARLKSGQCRL